MSEPLGTPVPGQPTNGPVLDPQSPSGSDSPEAKPYTPPATQADLDRIITDRLSRERAKYADYEQLKQDSVKLKGIEDAGKSEAQRLADEMAQIRQERDALAAESLRRQVADRKGIPTGLAGLLAGSTEAEVEAAADQVLAALADQQAQAGPRAPKPDPSQGKAPTAPAAQSVQDARQRYREKYTTQIERNRRG
ncbi:MAG: DUF4355 domain-containing protein [Propionibacteriaceae bacterium]|nr:DUF4355 domain-containing protein [Propionibacteriaceae bacterium]